MWTVDRNGVPQSPELNAYYWAFVKEGKSYEGETGFRVWRRAFETDPVFSADGGTFSYSAADWSSDITEYVWPAGQEPELSCELLGNCDKTDSGSGDGSGSGEDMEMMTDEELEEAAKGLGMMVMVIIIVAVACSLIMIVACIFCCVRASRNKKTPVELKEGGEMEMEEIDHETLE